MVYGIFVETLPSSSTISISIKNDWIKLKEYLYLIFIVRIFISECVSELRVRVEVSVKGDSVLVREIADDCLKISIGFGTKL